MATSCSFDITCGCDPQEVDNAVNQTVRELAQRFDFKGIDFEVVFERALGTIVLAAPDVHKLGAIWEVLRARLLRRRVPAENITLGDPVAAAGGRSRQTLTLRQGIDADTAKKIVKFLKDLRLKKVQAAVQSDQIRISGPSRDELQAAIGHLRGADFGLALDFGNFR